MPIIKTEDVQSSKAGSVTKEYIEKNQELLRDMKKEARGSTHDI